MQKFVINEVNIYLKGINAGVPQPFTLGPHLSIVFINDIIDDINNSIKLMLIIYEYVLKRAIYIAPIYPGTFYYA